MTTSITPARLAFTADGTPASGAYGDLYYSAAGGAGQARHVFLAGNGLPGRWQGRRRFVVLETGFGLGLNFLATWQAWREDPQRCERLHFVSVERHPLGSGDLRAAHAGLPELQPLAALLERRWPMLVPGAHRLEFDEGRVVLTLHLADIAALRGLRLAADAVYLDGFSPDRNPDMWAPEVMKAIARLCVPGATAATWSAAAVVREALTAAGFAVEKRPGYAGKRDMTVARLTRRMPMARTEALNHHTNRERRAVVVGAGIAGAALCERLALRGWSVTLLERETRPPAGDPGRHAGIFHPVVSADDNLLARLTRAAFLFARARWQELQDAGHALSMEACGALQLARDEEDSSAQRMAVARLAPPPEYVRWVESGEAADLVGVPVISGGLWYPTSGWIKPRSLIAAQLAQAGAHLDARFGVTVETLSKTADGWIARDAAGRVLAQAPVLILANAWDALRLAPSQHLRLRRVRGQISFLPAGPFTAPRAVLLRGGFVLPALACESVVGASYDFDDDDPVPRTSSHAGNLARLERILPGASAVFDPAQLQGMVGWRAVAQDRLPLAGALADDAAPAPKNAQLAMLARAPGLYGSFGLASRGLLWAGLGAEIIASLLEDEPLPVETALADAVDPGRFLLRALRQRSRRPA